VSTTQLDILDPSTWPSRRSEAWKWSDLSRMTRDAPSRSAPVAVAQGGPFRALGGEEMTFGNGHTPGTGHFQARGQQTLRLRFVSNTVGTGHGAHASITLEPGADLLLLESHEGLGTTYFAHNRVSIEVPVGAKLTRIVLAEDGEGATAISEAKVSVAPGGTCHQIVLMTGARLQRAETHLAHSGDGAEVRMDGVYVLKGSRHADMTSVVRHSGLDGVTSQLTKGVVHDQARGVFQGKIVVERGADGTDARMGHHALILGERAEVNAKPELEIYADDVSCAHGNTVGALDENALFYLQSRGLPRPEAQALLTEAFLMEVVERIEHEQAREVVRQWLTDRL
jgi:Fe-S cluster assembly protein SufD